MHFGAFAWVSGGLREQVCDLLQAQCVKKNCKSLDYNIVNQICGECLIAA